MWNSEEIIGCVVQNELDSLPECMRECAKAAYDAIVKLESGRLADTVIQAAFEGVDAVAELLANTEFGSLADSLKEGLTAFEKKCDELSAQQMTEAKYTAFGPDPLAAYYSAVETETKNVRVILSAKLNGFSADTIRARVREVYA